MKTLLTRLLFIISPVLAGIATHAEVMTHRAPEYQVTAKLKGSLLEIVATPPERHHFNLKAPMSLIAQGSTASLSSTVAKEQEIHFQILNPKTTDYFLTLYLCDDAKTFCEKHRVIVNWSSETKELHSRTAVSEGLTESKPVASKNESDSLGFILNKSEDAWAQAQKTKMPVLIDFFGIWCPPCNELDEEVFSSPEFKKESARFVKLKLDSDLDTSWALKSKYKVGGYPTVIFASSEGEEISRIVGFRSQKTFIKLMQQAWDSRARPLSNVMADAEKGNREALDRLGLAHLERKEYIEASQKLEKSLLYREKYYEALIGSLNQEGDKLVQILMTSIREFPKTPESIERRSQLASIYKDRKQPELQKRTLFELIENAKALIGAPLNLEDHEISVADLWSSIAEAQEAIGKSQLAKESWGKAVAEYRKKTVSGHERGYHLEMAYCLWKSGDFKAADQVYRTFEQLYPDEFTFYFNHASMKFEQKNFLETEKLANQALKYSYGDNRLRAAYLVGLAIKSQGRKREAFQTVHEVLQSARIPSDENIRTHRYLKKLQELEKELQA